MGWGVNTKRTPREQGTFPEKGGENPRNKLWVKLFKRKKGKTRTVSKSAHWGKETPSSKHGGKVRTVKPKKTGIPQRGEKRVFFKKKTVKCRLHRTKPAKRGGQTTWARRTNKRGKETAPNRGQKGGHVENSQKELNERKRRKPPLMHFWETEENAGTSVTATYGQNCSRIRKDFSQWPVWELGWVPTHRGGGNL